MRTGTGDDADLVRHVLEGDTAAFAGLVARHRDRLGRYAVRMLGNREDAEDAVQEAFIRAYRSLPRCDPDRFGPWLFTILVNRCRTFGAQRARRERLLAPAAEGYEGTSDRDPAEREAWSATVRWAVARLGAVYREALLLKHVEDLSYEEMAELTGASIPALKMRVKRACDQLRALLLEEDRVRFP
jgi:RNA polymerase sigma-70 factor (ECF subfamily)